MGLSFVIFRERFRIRIASHHGVGYQPLMRDILQRYVKYGLQEVLAHHQAKASETGVLVQDDSLNLAA